MNAAAAPSATVTPEAHATVTVPVSVIVVVAGLPSCCAAPAAVLAPVRIMIRVSPGSSTLSEVVGTVIVPARLPAGIVSGWLGAV